MISTSKQKIGSLKITNNIINNSSSNGSRFKNQKIKIEKKSISSSSSSSSDVIHVRIGDVAELTKTFTEEDVIAFSKLSLDTNPIHLDDSFFDVSSSSSAALYKKLFPRGRIVHGMLLTSLISAAVGTKLPGPGSVYIAQNFQFLKPAYVGSAVRARVEVIPRKPKPISSSDSSQQKKEEKKTSNRSILTLLTEVYSVETGEKIITGEGTVFHPKVALQEKNQ